MLVDYTKYKDFDKIQSIFDRIKELYDLEEDMKYFRTEDWSEDWDTGKHDPTVATWSYDVYNAYVGDRPVPEKYKELVKDIKSLDGICYAAVIVVNPNSVMPEHTDWRLIEGMDPENPDKTFTLLYYVKQPKTTVDKCAMTWNDKKLYLPEDSIVCLDGGRTAHSVYNHTDELRVTFCLSLLESSFDL